MPATKTGDRLKDRPQIKPLNSDDSLGAKIFERIIYDQLYKYLNDSKLLSSHQSGFRTVLTLPLLRYLKQMIVGH